MLWYCAGIHGISVVSSEYSVQIEMFVVLRYGI
jgi:hypothetical protein